jgi:SAM-dependent methyltransferase
MNGGYDAGYKACPCFWGREPGSLVRKLEALIGDFTKLEVLDVGCGEGKNASFLTTKGARVRAVDVSRYAIENGKKTFGTPPGLSWEVGDVRTVELEVFTYDIVVAYGLLHCLASEAEVLGTIKRLKSATKLGGFNIVCCFNDRYQDLSAHPGLTPTLLTHSGIVDAYRDWEIIVSTDSDLVEAHPDNEISHRHSLTRLIARSCS